MDALVASGRMLAAELVREEAEAVGTAGLIQWVQTNSGMFVPTASLLMDSLAVQNQFTGLRDPKAEYEEADPYVIALAQQNGGIVVTQETPAVSGAAAAVFRLRPVAARARDGDIARSHSGCALHAAADGAG